MSFTLLCIFLYLHTAKRWVHVDHSQITSVDSSRLFLLGKSHSKSLFKVSPDSHSRQPGSDETLIAIEEQVITGRASFWWLHHVWYYCEVTQQSYQSQQMLPSLPPEALDQGENHPFCILPGFFFCQLCVCVVWTCWLFPFSYLLVAHSCGYWGIAGITISRQPEKV